MLRLTLRNLAARKLRLLMSTLGIVLGVGFLAGVLVFSNGLSHTFDGILKGSTSGGLVRTVDSDSFNYVAPNSLTLSEADVARLAALPEVAKADGGVNGYNVYLLDKEGDLVGGTGAPTLAFNYTDTPNMLGEPMLQLTDGDWPRGSGDVVLDEGAAARGGYEVGDQVTIITPGADLSRKFTLAGTAEFNGGGTAGAVLILLDTREAQDLFLGGRDVYSVVNLTAAEGVSQRQLADAANRVVPEGFEAVTGDTVVAESENAIGGLLDVISTFLLVFAVLAVVVGGFIIVNTFTILAAQRTRELALVRAIGASRRQVTGSVLLEALAMALVAATIGIALGWGLARGLATMIRGIGLDIQGRALELTPRTILVSYLVGVGVTLLAAYLPARRAAKVAPVAAMQDDRTLHPGSLRRRVVIGSAVLVLSGVVAIAGVLGAPGNAAVWVGVGAGLCILTIAAISAAVGKPVLAACRTTFGRLFGFTGRLAGENALRDPRRTGATASALMIGLALVSLIGVLAASLNSSVDDQVDNEFSADYVVQSAAFSPFPATLGDHLADVPGVGTVVRQQYTGARLEGETTYVMANESTFDQVYDLDVVSGRQRLGPSEALAFRETADEHGWRVGSTFDLTFPGGKRLHLTVAGIVEESATTAPISIRLADLAKVGIGREDYAISIVLTPGADAATVNAALNDVVDPLPMVSVLDKDEYADTIRGQVNQLLYLIYGLLALSVVIAVIGIVNTLSLSMIERTREIGLLRAVGLSRPQLRRMVTLESVAIALLGAALGLVLGVVFGVLMRQALRDDLTSLEIPLAQLAMFLLVAVVVGVLAAVVPAIRAARLDILRAIATE
jgi:putative ABC transport system permease protein